MGTICEECKPLLPTSLIPQLESTTTPNGKIGFQPSGDESLITIPLNRIDEAPLIPKLAASAKTGCEFCQLLHAVILEDAADVEGEVTILNASYGWEYFQGAKYLSKFTVEIESEDDYAVCYFDVVAEKDSALAQQFWILNKTVDAGYMSDTSIARIKTILELPELAKMMEAMETGSEPVPDIPKITLAQLPTRLIELGESDADAAKLILTREDPRFMGEQALPKYVALSYCWGTEDATHRFFKTEKGSLASRMRALSAAENDLPQTFKDAFAVTRALGYQFLWIDALCIIQDDERDWQQEASRMSDVYSGAAVTIVPSNCESSWDGFLRPKHDNATEYHIAIPQIDNDMPSGKIILRRAKDLSSILDPQLKDSKWITRGWTYQELLLSPNLLVFTPTSLLLQINGQTAYAIDGAHNLIEVNALDAFEDWFEALPDESPQTAGWYWLIKAYSSRQFTKPSDKLAALSALARVYGRKRGCAYLAGLWESTLLFDLLWVSPLTVEQFEERPNWRSPTYRAPSWSWAAGDLPVKWPLTWYAPQRRMPFAAEVVEASTEPKGIDEYGEVVGARITLKARTLRVETTTIRDEDFELIRVVGQVMQVEGVFLLSFEFEDGETVYSAVSLDWGLDPAMVERIHQERVTLVELLDDVEDGVMEHEVFPAGLLLLSAGEEKEYIRVGLFYKVKSAEQGITFEGAAKDNMTII